MSDSKMYTKEGSEVFVTDILSKGFLGHFATSDKSTWASDNKFYFDALFTPPQQ